MKNSHANAGANPLPVIIDTDPGIDDAVAMALAPRLPQLDVVAITTVHGNVDVSRATRNARLVARRSALHVPVVAGAAAPLIRPARPARETHGEEGLGHVVPQESAVNEPDQAVGAIIGAAAARPGVALACLGPLTNLARALEADAGLSTRLGPVIVMGGALAVRGTMTRWSEFNWWSDPEAVAAVLASGLDLRLVPLDVTRRIAVPGNVIRKLQAAGRDGDPDAAFWAEALSFYADFHTAYESFDGCVINDPLAIALLADSSLAEWRTLRIGVAGGEDEKRGSILLDEHPGARVQVAVTVRAQEVLRLVATHVLGPWVTCEEMEAGAAAADAWLRENPLQERGQ